MAKIRIEGLTHQRALWANNERDVNIAMVGPLGCGKTFGLAFKALVLASVNKGCDGMLVVPSYPIARKVHFRDWPKIWSSLGVSVRHNRSDNAFEWPWGDRVWVGTADNPDSLVGPNLAYVLFDEPGLMDREAWDRASVRTRHPKASLRQNVLGGTPEGINWFADLFNDPGKKYRTIWARTWHKDMAHYPAQLIERYGYDQSLLQAYGMGQFVPLRVGRCYPMFDRVRHTDKTVKYESGLPLVLACDFNIDAMRWEVLQLTTTEIRVLDEIAPGRNSRTVECAKEFVSRWGAKHAGQVVITGDRAGKSRSTSGTTDYLVLTEVLRAKWSQVFMRVPPANPLIKDRVETVNYHLSGRGRTVRVSPKCKELMLDFERVIWKEGIAEEDKTDVLRTHASSALGYALWVYARVKPRGLGGSGVLAKVSMSETSGAW